MKDAKAPPGTRESPREISLRHGRWYQLTLADGTRVVAQAWNLCPEHTAWQLLGGRDDVPAGDVPVHLEVRPDGSFKLVGGEEPRASDRQVRAIREGSTAHDLVPADDRARAAWLARAGVYVSCPRCGGSDPSGHHPLCHTAEGIPLFPDFDPHHWRGEISDTPTRLAGGIATDPLRERCACGWAPFGRGPG